MFSPHYYRARKRSAYPDPARHCGFNLALYSRGKNAWVFTEHHPSAIHRSEEAFVIGDSVVRWDGDALVARVEERTAVLGQRVSGEIRLHPHNCFQHPVALDPNGRHHWWAVAPHARVELKLDRPGLKFSGSGYHDTNFGREPLEAGFQDWSWSRAELEEGAAILYDARPRAGEGEASMIQRGFLFRQNGELDALEAPRELTLPNTRWGIARPTRCDALGEASADEVRVLRDLEDTPFYSRSLIQTRLRGQSVRAVHESLSLDRFDTRWVQLMLPFRLRRGRRQ